MHDGNVRLLLYRQSDSQSNFLIVRKCETFLGVDNFEICSHWPQLFKNCKCRGHIHFISNTGLLYHGLVPFKLLPACFPIKMVADIYRKSTFSVFRHINIIPMFKPLPDTTKNIFSMSSKSIQSCKRRSTVLTNFVPKKIVNERRIPKSYWTNVALLGRLCHSCTQHVTDSTLQHACRRFS